MTPKPRALPIVITREPDDKLAEVRVSIGGSKTLGYYLTFRGDPKDVIRVLETMTAVAKVALPAGKYADKRGRPQG